MSDILNFVKGVTKGTIKTAIIPLEAVSDVAKGRKFDKTAELIEDAGNNFSDALISLFGEGVQEEKKPRS